MKEAYRVLLSRAPGIELIEWGNFSLRNGGREGIKTLSVLCPDVILVGVKTLDQELFQGLELVQEVSPETGVVILFGYYNGNGTVRKTFRKLRKGAFLSMFSVNTADELVQVIQSVHRGKVILDPQLFGVLLQGGGDGSFIEDLTPKEREILSLMAKGYKNSAIAHILFLEVKTVEHYINRIFSKLNCGESSDLHHPRVEAVLLYLKAMGFLNPEFESSPACSSPTPAATRN